MTKKNIVPLDLCITTCLEMTKFLEYNSDEVENLLGEHLYHHIRDLNDSEEDDYSFGQIAERLKRDYDPNHFLFFLHESRSYRKLV